MKRFILKIIWGVCLSGACYAGVEYWHANLTSVRSNYGNLKPLAILKYSYKDVQRKPIKRLIWETIKKNELLYSGEEIRTNSESEAQIIFINSRTLIQLEPDSLISIEDNKGAITLDFISGHALVKSEGKQGDETGSIKLKSGDNSLDLASSNVSLSKEKNSKDLRLKVNKGAVKLTNQQGGTTTLDKDSDGTISKVGLKADVASIKILSPLPGTPIYALPKTNKKARFSWKKIDPKYEMFLEIGKSRTQLNRISESTIDMARSTLSAPIKSGTFYWRLVAKGPVGNSKLPTLKSPISRTKLVTLRSPVLTIPAKDAKIILKKDNKHKIDLKWVSKTQMDSFILEVSSDVLLKKVIISKDYSGKTRSTSMSLNKSGNYFWRVTGYKTVNGKSEALSSKISSFYLQKGILLTPPKLKSPLNSQNISYSQAQTKGVFFTWKSVPGIANYKLTLKSISGGKKQASKPITIEKETPLSRLKLRKLKAGKYTWHISSLGEKNKVSAPSEKRTLVISKIPSIQWTRRASPDEYFYFTKDPSVYLSWEDNLPAVTSWRIRWKEKGSKSPSPEVGSQKVTKSHINTPLNHQGSYEFVVQGVNNKGVVLAVSSPKIVSITERDLLPAPRFSGATPDMIKTNKKGAFQIQWTPVDGAENYLVEIRDLKGNISRQKMVSKPSVRINRLKPGEYKASVRAVDQYKRQGPMSKVKGVRVPNKSDISAPKLKSISIE